jgi:hypothetical protein
MTNAINLIKKFIVEKRIQKMKKWSERLNSQRLHSDYLKSLIRSTRSLLDILSGNDTIAMLKSKSYQCLVLSYDTLVLSIDFRIALCVLLAAR